MAEWTFDLRISVELQRVLGILVCLVEDSFIFFLMLFVMLDFP